MINTWILLVALVALTGLRVVSGAERHEAVASSEGQLWLGPDEIVMAYDEVFLWNIGSVVEAYGEISLWLGPDEIVMAYGEGSLWLGPDEIEMAYGEAQLSLQEKEPDYIIKGYADPADGGKVTGGGFCAEGKRVTLKATANKGFVFIGWKKDDGEEGDALKAATLVFDRTVKPAQSNAKQCVITEFTGDEIWCARFVTSEFDKENIAAAVDGLSLEPWVSKDETHAAVTNIWAGVYLEWPVAADALSETTVKVTGLPAGLKFAAKPVTAKVTSGSGKLKVTTVVTNVPANTIYGAPTAASKVDKKTGKVTPSAVKLAVTTAGKSTQTFQIDTTVDPLPDRVQGTFFGGSTNESFAGSANLTVAASGKISGKWISEGKTWTLAANYFDRYDQECEGFVVDLSAKSGKDTDRFPLVVTRDGLAMGEDGIEMWWANWKVEPWKSEWKDFDKTAVEYWVDKDGKVSDGRGEDAASTGRVTLTFAANGTAKVVGEFALLDANGEPVYKKGKLQTVKATGSATVLPVADAEGVVGYRIFIYLAPKGLSPHARFMEF